MKKTETGIPGLYILEPDVFADERGWFMEALNPRTLNDLGIKVASVVQVNHTHTKAHAFRGLHFQREPMGQAKYVRCLHGRCFDVVVDIRKGSPTYGKTAVFELSGENRRILWVPIGFAHGFYAAEDSDFEYVVFGSGRYQEYEDGIRIDGLGEEFSWEEFLKSHASQPGPPIMKAGDMAWPTLAELSSSFVFKGPKS